MSKERKYRMINGAPLCAPERQVGYCWCELHPGYLHKHLMDEHQCVERKCEHFEKFKDSEYWKRKAKIKEDRIAGKLEKKRIEQLCTSIYQEFENIFVNNSNIAILNVEHLNGTYITRLVTIGHEGTSDIVKSIERKYQVKIKVVYVQNTYQFRKELIQKKNGVNT